MQTDSSELILNDRNYKPIRGANRNQLDTSQSYLQVEDRYRNLSFERRNSKQSRSNSSLGQSRSPYRAHRTQSRIQNSNERNPQGILKSRSPSKTSSPDQKQHLSSTHSSPYRRSQMEISGARAYKSRMSASPIDSLKKDSVSSHNNDHLRSRSRSRSGAPVSNQKGFQVVRDHRGIKRKIEYPSSEEEQRDENNVMGDSLAYSKSIVKHNSKLKLQKVDTPQFEHTRKSDLDSKRLDIMQLESSPIRETRPTEKSPGKLLQSS